MKILVCGGAGYIGSHMCKLLAHSEHEPIAFDNLSTGHEWAVRWGPLIRGDLLDMDALAAAFGDHRIDAVIHFAARSTVAESMANPGLYFRNNVTGTINLLDAMRAARVDTLVFSSTAAVYGNPQYTPIDEAHPSAPINPYGWSKLMAERAIEEYCRAHGLRAASLRYFNAAGADTDGDIGEAHEPETHLLPNIIKAVLDPASGPVSLFGDDYDTADGTCIRDYVHVEDLCAAHLRAIEYLAGNSGFVALNLGTGCGSSVRDVLAACLDVAQCEPPSRFEARRPGDPAVLVASNSAAETLLGWRPTRTLADCVRSALAWHRAEAASARRSHGVRKSGSPQ